MQKDVTDVVLFIYLQKRSTDVKTNLERVAEALNNKTQKHITDVCDLCPGCVGKFHDWLRSANKDGD